MKKFIIVLLSFIVVLLSSCNKGYEIRIPSDVLSNIMSAYGKFPVSDKYFISGVDENSKHYLTRKEFCKIYLDDNDDTYGYYLMMDEYSVYLSSNLTLFEIHIIKAKHLSDVDNIKRVFGYRAKQIKSSLMNYESDIKKDITITSKGLYVYMFITDNNQIALDSI